MNDESQISRRILCVDDDASLLAALGRRLRGQFELTTSEDPREALRLIETQGPFAVIIADYHMPLMDGLTFLREARKLDPDSVMVMMTIWSQAAADAINTAQVFRFLAKPCPAGLLEAILVDSLEHYRLVHRERLLVQELNAANTRLKNLNVHLLGARDEALAASQAKSEFLANISHEIRTPMTAILGYADLLLHDELGPGDRKRALETVRGNGDYLLEIINDILDLSKIEAGMLSVQRVTCSPARILGEVASLMRVKADAKGLDLRVVYKTPIPEKIRTDPLRVRQILINLVGNAVKFTSTGSIQLSAQLLDSTSTEPRMMFEVADTGIGITPEQSQRLFKPYSQADSSISNLFGGTGLGLTISRRLAQMLGGDIFFNSTPGQGATFCTTIKTGSLIGVTMWACPSEALLAETEHAQKLPTSLRLDGRILLVEDGVDNQRLIAFLLEKAGADVTLADNGKIAVDLVAAAEERGESFNVILMDMQMPVMDGYQATRCLRNRGYRGHIIALTAHAMAEDRARCMAAGCDSFLAKPIDRSLLIGTVAHYSSLETMPQAPAAADCPLSGNPCYHRHHDRIEDTKGDGRAEGCELNPKDVVSGDSMCSHA